MDSALDCKDGQTVNITALLKAERQTPGAWAKAKAERSWECPDCKGFAWMVKRNSSAGHFSAHHRSGCLLEGRRVESAPGAVDPQKHPQNNDGDLIELRLEPPATGRAGHEVHADGTDPDEGGRKGAGLGDGERMEGHRRSRNLSSLLRRLVADDGYVDGLVEAGAMFEVTGRGLVKPDDLIWSMDELDPRNEALIGRHVIVWGQVYSANDARDQQTGFGSGYLNQGAAGYNKGAVEVPAATVRELLARHEGEGVEYFADFGKWYVIAYGTTRRMGNGGVGITPLNSSAVILMPPPEGQK